MTLKAALEEPRTTSSTAKAVVWREGAWWLGYWQEFPDHPTQGESAEDLEAHLHDLWLLLTGGDIVGPSARRVVEMDVPVPAADAA